MKVEPARIVPVKVEKTIEDIAEVERQSPTIALVPKAVAVGSVQFALIKVVLNVVELI